MSIQPGRLIGGNLRLVRLLGRGAMGSVWLADHLGLQSQVAVKFMAQAMLEDPVSLQRFQQEAKAAAEIRSPHVVRVFDQGTSDDGHPYIVMEVLDGESLEKRIKQRGPLNLHAWTTMVSQACKALAKAHERGIIHRDIKPGNIFLTQDDDLFVKVLDFGVAKFSGQEAIDMTAQGNMVGTPAYMSPEQLFHGKSVDHRGDLWSLAVVAYHALTGARPFDGVTLGELCIAIKRGEYTPPSKLRSDASPAIDAWFGRAFARELNSRFSSAKELAMALEHAVGISSAMGSAPSLVAPSQHVATFPGIAVSTEPGVVRSRRRWWLAGAAALCLAGSGIASTLWLLGGDRPSASERSGASAAAASSAWLPSPAPPPAEAPPPATTPSVSASAAQPDSAAATEAEPPVGAGEATATTKSRTAPPSAGSAVRGESDERSRRAGEQLGI